MVKTKSDFMLAITQLAAEKNLPREVVLGVVESALVSAFRKNSFAPNQSIAVKVDPNTGQVRVFATKMVVDVVSDPRCEMSLDQARAVKEYAQIGDEVQVEDTPRDAGRIAAQTAKQVVLQRLREAERELVFEEYSDRESELVTGVIQRIEPRQIVLELGRTEGVLPSSEQIKSEHYRVGQRIKVYIVEVHKTGRGPQVIVSRTHRNLLRRLLELEVPEINTGLIELKAVAREPGARSKIAVAARQQGVDAIGSCVGLRGIRIQNIVNELNGEKIDVIEWHPDAATFIASSLNPAQVTSVAINPEEKSATVVVPDRQLSLAIGKEGQNARLAAKLTGWRIDIKSASTAESEGRVVEKEETLAEDLIPAEDRVSADADEVVESVETVTQADKDEVDVDLASLEAEGLALEPEVEETEEIVEEEVRGIPVVELPVENLGPVIRFAEDILPDRAGRGGKKAKKTKKGKEKLKPVGEEVAKGTVKPKKDHVHKLELDDEELEEVELPPKGEELDVGLEDNIELEPIEIETAIDTEPIVKKEKKTASKPKGRMGDDAGKAGTKSKTKKGNRGPKAHKDRDDSGENW